MIKISDPEEKTAADRMRILGGKTMNYKNIQEIYAAFLKS
jgi:hypothetical protein